MLWTSTGNPPASTTAPSAWTRAPSCPRFPRALGREQRRAAAGLLAQVRPGELEHAGVGDRGREHVVDRQLDVRAVVAVEDEREAVRRLDPEQDGTRAVARLARRELRID